MKSVFAPAPARRQRANLRRPTTPLIVPERRRARRRERRCPIANRGRPELPIGREDDPARSCRRATPRCAEGRLSRRSGTMMLAWSSAMIPMSAPTNFRLRTMGCTMFTVRPKATDRRRRGRATPAFASLDRLKPAADRRSCAFLNSGRSGTAPMHSPSAETSNTAVL